MSKIEAILGSPPERERLVVQLFVDEGQWGEVTAETKTLMLELYPKQGGGEWVLNLDEVLKILQISKERLEETNRDAIEARALQFASTFAYVNPKILSSTEAPAKVVEKHGTRGSTQYGEVRIHMEWSSAHIALIESEKLEQRADLETFLRAGVELRVVCSASDIIFHDFPDIDFN